MSFTCLMCVLLSQKLLFLDIFSKFSVNFQPVENTLFDAFLMRFYALYALPYIKGTCKPSLL